MALELVTIPCLTDNYAYLIRDDVAGLTALVDVPDAAPIRAELTRREWSLDQIFLTHHHDDHIQGVAELRQATGARVLGAEADRHRLPPLDQALRQGDFVMVGAHMGRVIDVPGHTVGHIAFLFQEDNIAFTGDSLMAAGCGRLFEGTPAQMFASLQSLAQLSPETLICSGHEYTLSNLRFAAHVDPGNPAVSARMMRVVKARAEGRPTVPSRLSGELQTNPFLRAGEPDLAQAMGIPGASAESVFAALREAKNSF